MQPHRSVWQCSPAGWMAAGGGQIWPAEKSISWRRRSRGGRRKHWGRGWCRWWGWASSLWSWRTPPAQYSPPMPCRSAALAMPAPSSPRISPPPTSVALRRHPWQYENDVCVCCLFLYMIKRWTDLSLVIVWWLCLVEDCDQMCKKLANPLIDLVKWVCSYWWKLIVSSNWMRWGGSTGKWELHISQVRSMHANGCILNTYRKKRQMV